MTEDTKSLRDPMLFAVRAEIGRRVDGGREPRLGGYKIRPQGGDGAPGDGNDAEDDQRSLDYPLHVLIS
jgi:hypothetical protein